MLCCSILLHCVRSTRANLEFRNLFTRHTGQNYRLYAYLCIKGSMFNSPRTASFKLRYFRRITLVS
jgi:hypothetical protein